MKKVPLGVLLVAGLSVSVLSKAKEPQPTYLVDIPNPAACYDNDGTNSVGTKKLIPPAVSGDNKATIVICKLSKDKSFTYWAKATPPTEFLVDQ